MKHVYLLGEKHYAFYAVGPYTKEAVMHTACSPSSRNTKAAPEKAVARFGKTVKVVNDNSSENMKDTQGYLASLGITRYWARPKSPKEKPFAERSPARSRGNVLTIITSLLAKYHCYRPHEALNFLTPAGFSAALGLSIPRAGVS
jgi:transposase InsO family protein